MTVGADHFALSNLVENLLQIRHEHLAHVAKFLAFYVVKIHTFGGKRTAAVFTRY